MMAVGPEEAASQSYAANPDYTLQVSEDTERTVMRDPPLPVYENGSILIYNFTQLLLIGSGEPVRDLDAYTADVGNGEAVTGSGGSGLVYGMDCQYQIVQDISLPRHTEWSIPSGFTGSISGTPVSDPSLYDSETDTIYIYNPYQLAVMASQNAESEPVMTGDASSSTFGTGQVIIVDDNSQRYLTYGGDHNYVLGSEFSSDTSGQSPSLIGNSSNSAQYDGRDFAGQVIKKINGDTYILIGNQEQLRAIGTDEEVFTAVYQTDYVISLSYTGHVIDTDNNGDQIILYG